MSSRVTVYEGSDDWSAVYVDGRLAQVGDHYLADEFLRRHFGVETVQSDDFLRGGSTRADVAPTLDDLQVWADERDARAARAEQMRLDAAELLAQAERMTRMDAP